jgi:protein-tyrosine phosphatase
MNLTEGSDDERIIKLQGAHNFRDLGGYTTQDGRIVAKRKIFRSSALAKLSEHDYEMIRGLGIRAIYDLRANEERIRRPSALPENMPIDIWSRDYEGSAGNLLTKMAAPDGTTEQTRQIMIETYRILPYEQAESYRALFLHLAEGELPVLFHCSAGKDRTGIAAALLLEILLVPRATIIEDYLLTDLFFEQGLEIALHALGTKALHGIPQEIWAPLMRADQIYIETLFETLEARHGSVSGYFRDVLGLDDAIEAQLRARLRI